MDLSSVYLWIICIPYLQQLVSATWSEHACVQWVPLHGLHTKLVGILVTAVDLSHAGMGELRAACHIVEVMDGYASRAGEQTEKD